MINALFYSINLSACDHLITDRTPSKGHLNCVHVIRIALQVDFSFYKAVNLNFLTYCEYALIITFVLTKSTVSYTKETEKDSDRQKKGDWEHDELIFNGSIITFGRGS